MYSWLKYVAWVLIGAFIGDFLFDVIKHARARGGQWKDILLRIIIWIVLLIIAVVLNLWINRNWIPGECLFVIDPFGG